MDFLEWVETMRKKPLAERRRFAAVTTITVMAVVAAVWFVFFFLNLGAETGSQSQPEITSFPSLPALPPLDPRLESLIHQLGF